MIAVGITGQAGFMGSHLYNLLGIKDNIKRIPFKDDYFNDEGKLMQFVRQCDVIIHLAAMNRHGDPQVIYDTNLRLVNQVIDACEQTNSKPHIIFSSSTQEKRDNLYGKSKIDGRKLFENWAKRHKAKFTGLIIPNVFGPFGHPFYNSVIATFSYQLSHSEEPRIEVDASMKLIYINELVELIYQFIIGSISETKYHVPPTKECRVSEILEIMISFRDEYLKNGYLPDISETFKLALFNTFRCYMPDNIFPVRFNAHKDERGSFVEIARCASGGQYSFSTTRPGITRGNHFHTRKFERFAVIKGNARIQLRKIDSQKILNYEISGGNPAYVDIPVWHTHNITNIGKTELITLFWINETYNQADPDTYFEKVEK